MLFVNSEKSVKLRYKYTGQPTIRQCLQKLQQLYTKEMHVQIWSQPALLSSNEFIGVSNDKNIGLWSPIHISSPMQLYSIFDAWNLQLLIKFLFIWKWNILHQHSPNPKPMEREKHDHTKLDTGSSCIQCLLHCSPKMDTWIMNALSIIDRCMYHLICRVS